MLLNIIKDEHRCDDPRNEEQDEGTLQFNANDILQLISNEDNENGDEA